mgnify:CR=1 FL=1
MEHITKQEDVTVTRIVSSLNTLDDENMVVVSTTEAEKKKDGLIKLSVMTPIKETFTSVTKSVPNHYLEESIIRPLMLYKEFLIKLVDFMTLAIKLIIINHHHP